MKKFILFLIIGLLLNSFALADDNCFLATENKKVIRKHGNCSLRYSPASTFKIAISLMAYQEGLLLDETNPELPFKQDYTDWLDIWKQPHNPTTWMKHSCVWYSQFLMQKIGAQKFKDYIVKFDYGNQDISGDEGKSNGLTNAWLGSSLEISPEEQILFLQALVNNRLPVSLNAQTMTRNILFVEELSDGWKLYGKTGNSSQLDKTKKKKLDIQQGWFIGWIQKDDRTIIFANHIVDNTKQDTYASIRAKTAAKEQLLKLVKVIENR